MPHVIVKLFSGRSEQEKTRLSEEIVGAVKRVLGHDDRSISVGIEEVEPQDWAEKVYKPDILSNGKTIYKQPGYNPFR